MVIRETYQLTGANIISYTVLVSGVKRLPSPRLCLSCFGFKHRLELHSTFITATLVKQGWQAGCCVISLAVHFPDNLFTIF